MADADDADVPESGAVFTFGKSKFADNLPSKFWVRSDPVLQVACGDEHTALVAESGRVFMLGPNDWGQLGIGPQKAADRPMCIKTLKGQKCRLVACGRLHTVIATETGHIYTCGANGENQLGIEEKMDRSLVPIHVKTLKPTPYRMLAAGADHSMALTEDGRVFVWGGNGEGQLGMGNVSEVAIPQELHVGQQVICISCGYYHSALVTEKGELYTFGESDGGKLGLGDETDESKKPQHVAAISDRVKTVSCGGSHTAALTESGDVYTFGEGCHGQLGLGVTVLNSNSPLLLRLPFKVREVCCGENFTAVISERGQLYTFGDGRHGKLALGQESFSNQFTESKVDRFAKFIVRQVACGGCHMIVLASCRTENGEVESEDDGEEVIEEKTLLNGSLRNSTDLNLSRSFTARDRRRNASPSPLRRTLPALGNRTSVPLSATMPLIRKKEEKSLRSEITPRIQRSKKIDKMAEDEDDSEDSEEVSEKEEDENKLKPKILPRTMPPKPSEANGDSKHKDDSEKGESSDEQKADAEDAKPSSHDNGMVDVSETDKESEEKNENGQEESDQEDAESDSDDKANEADSEMEDEDEKETLSLKHDKRTEQVEKQVKEVDSAVVEEQAVQSAAKQEEDDSATEEEIVDLKRMPRPLPRKVKEDTEEEDDDDKEAKSEEEEPKEKAKKKEKDKKNKDKKDDKEDEDKKDKKKIKKSKAGQKGEGDAGEEDEEEEDEDQEEKAKSKKDKKSKKEKEDKKKKGKKDKEKKDKEKEEEVEENEEDKKSKKDNDKKKKKKKDDSKKEKDKDDDKEKEAKKDGQKQQEKEAPPVKKKSRFCVVL